MIAEREEDIRKASDEILDQRRTINKLRLELEETKRDLKWLQEKQQTCTILGSI